MLYILQYYIFCYPRQFPSEKVERELGEISEPDFSLYWRPGLFLLSAAQQYNFNDGAGLVSFMLGMSYQVINDGLVEAPLS